MRFPAAVSPHFDDGTCAVSRGLAPSRHSAVTVSRAGPVRARVRRWSVVQPEKSYGGVCKIRLNFL